MVLVLCVQALETRCVGLAILAIIYSHLLLPQHVCRLAQILVAISQMGLPTTAIVFILSDHTFHNTYNFNRL